MSAPSSSPTAAASAVVAPVPSAAPTISVEIPSNPKATPSPSPDSDNKSPSQQKGGRRRSPNNRISPNSQNADPAAQMTPEQYASYMQTVLASQPPRYFSLDVECVATGPKHNERAVAQVALVDQWERVVLNFYVKPTEKVFSYLPLLTGLNEQLVSSGIDMDAAVALVKSRIPPNAILVGQNILKDVTWLNLEEGRDFGSMLDLSGLWRVFNEKYKSWSYFSLQHQAKALLGILQEPPHNAATDAILSIRLYNLYRHIEHNQAEMDRAHKALLNTAIDVSFAKQHPEYDGVCMGNKKTCTCGAPFFF